MLYQAGDKFEYCYAIRTGSFKGYSILNDGDRQVTGFYLPGEIVSLDSIASECHKTIVEALEDSYVCIISYKKLESLALELPSLQHQLYKILSQKVEQDHELIALLNRKNSDEKVASFLINLSTRFSKRGLSKEFIPLTMGRSDIGNYLGLASETVSRIFVSFKNQGIISYQGKGVQINDYQGLAKIAGVDCA